MIEKRRKVRRREGCKNLLEEDMLKGGRSRSKEREEKEKGKEGEGRRALMRDEERM